MRCYEWLCGRDVTYMPSWACATLCLAWGVQRNVSKLFAELQLDCIMHLDMRQGPYISKACSSKLHHQAICLSE